MPKLPSRTLLASSSILLLCVGFAAQGCGSDDSQFDDVGGDDDASSGGTSGGIIVPGDGGSSGTSGASGDAAIRPLTITPATADIKVTKINGVVTRVPESITFVASRDGAPVSDAHWFLQQGELGAIDGATGQFVPNGNSAGTGTIIATANGGTGQALVHVTLEGEQNGGISDGTSDPGNCATAPGGCGGVGGEPMGGAVLEADLTKLKTQAPEADAGGFSYLYPYDKTVFPRGILAPLLQWDWAKTAKAVSVKVTSPGVTFTGYYAYPVGATPEARQRIRIDQPAWRSALNVNDGGSFLEVDVTLLDSNDKVYGPFKRQLIVSPAPLTGTVYYNSYDSRLTGQGVVADATHPETGVLGGVLSIKVSSSDPTVSATPQVALPLRTPQVGDPQQKKCTACHVVSANGSTMFVQDGTRHDEGGNDSSSDYGHSLSFDLQQEPASRAEHEYADYPNDKHKFTWSAPYPDGTFALSSSKITREARRVGNSGLWSKADGSAVSNTGLGAVDAVTPAFAPDGSKVAFSLWGGNVGGAPGNARSLVAMDFACGAAPGSPACVGADKTFSAGRQLYTDPARYPAWPSFLPDSSGVVFNNGFGDSGQDQSKDPSASFTDCTIGAPDASSNNNCHVATWYRGTAEIWLAPDGGNAALLSLLNGKNGSTSYLRGRGRAGGVEQCRPHALDTFDERRRRLLDHLLVAALDRALPLADGPDGAVLVGHDLHLDVPSGRQVGLAEDGRVTERARGLGSSGLGLARQVLERTDDAHPAPAPTGVGLDQYRQVVGGDVLGRVLGQDGHPGRGHQPLRLDLAAHGLDRLGRRADPRQARGLHRPGEPGVLGQEPVTRVDRVRPGPQRRGHDQVGPQIGLGRRAARQPYGGVGLTDVRRIRVGVGEHGDGAQPEVAAGPEHPARDLPPVGHEHGGDHGRATQRGTSCPAALLCPATLGIRPVGAGRAKRRESGRPQGRVTGGTPRNCRRPGPGRCGSLTVRCPARCGCRGGR